MKCSNCGASFSDELDKCSYCNEPSQKLELELTIEEKINRFIKYIEVSLDSQKTKYDIYSVPVFFVITILWLYIGYRIYLFNQSLLYTIPINLIIGFAFFISWGLLIQYLEEKAFQEEFDSKMKKELVTFLNENRIKQSDFKISISENIKPDSPLRKIKIDL